MLIETDRLTITEFNMDMAQAVQENSVDEDNKKFLPVISKEIGITEVSGRTKRNY